MGWIRYRTPLAPRRLPAARPGTPRRTTLVRLGHRAGRVLALAAALGLLAAGRLLAQSRGSLQASARVLPTPARVVVDRAIEQGIALARRSDGRTGRLVRVTWAAARIEADQREVVGRRGRLLVTVSYVRN